MLTFSRLLDVLVLGLVAWALVLMGMRVRCALDAAHCRRVWWASVGLWAIVWTASTPAIVLGGLGMLEVPPVALSTLDVPAMRSRTALVVLSSSVSPPVPGDTAIERLDAASTARTLGAARVWRVLQTGGVIVTGRAPGSRPEATVEAMRDLLVWHGVPASRVVLEPWALNTRQNARHAVRLGHRLGFRRYVVVTSALHMRRALREFRRAGVEALAAPVHYASSRHGGPGDWVPSSWALGVTNAVVHELLGMLKP